MKKVFIFILFFFGVILLLFYFDVIWRSPSFYKVEKQKQLDIPIMDMGTYMKKHVSSHRRPYIYNIKSNKGGKVIILGIEHNNDGNNPQFDSIRKYWNQFKPTVALVEGRLGFFLKWAHNPIKKYGESGLTSYLAKKNNANLYTWEPTRDDEIELLIQKYNAKDLAMFYSLRPFFDISKKEREINPKEKLQKLINERTDCKHLKGSITTWNEIDSIWKKNFPDLDWRNYSTNYGWPGYLHDIWNSSNLSRDEHMVKSIIELVEKGETVFVTMGSSHAPRIENTLKNAIK